MLKKTLMICTLAIYGTIGLQAIEQVNPSNPLEQVEQNHEADQQVVANEEKGTDKDLTPGILVCNLTEEECSKGEELEQTSPTDSVLSLRANQAEVQLFACKHCR